LVAAGSLEHTPDEVKWLQVQQFDVLGHSVSCTGAVRPSWSRCRAKMWASFFANFAGAEIKKAPLSSKIACLDRAVKPMMTYRCSLWAPQRQIGNELDALQRKMISISCPIHRVPGEDSDHFARRRGRHASGVAKDAGLWSKHWFGRALAWDEHVQRNRSGCRWNSSLRAFHDSSWLQERRSFFAAISSSRVNAWTSLAGRTATRAAAGKVQPRWQEAVQKVRDGSL
jgi:hypothetical protein